MLHESIPQAKQDRVISAKSPLVFMHITKTGGMSLLTAFTSLWGTSIANLYNISPRHTESAAELIADPNKALYCGHYSYGLHHWFDRPVYYASVIREPLARVVSLYYFFLPRLKHFHSILQKHGGNLSRLATLPNMPDYYLDFGSCIMGDQTAEAFFASSCADLENGMVRRFSGYGLNPEPCPAEALKLAKQNIEKHFSVVGLLERYPETLQLMSNTFSLPELSKDQVNVNDNGKEKNPPLNPVIIDKIRAMNELDIALYNWVSERFDDCLQKPRPPILVTGGGNKYLTDMPLWRAVGQLEFLEAPLEQSGVSVANKPVPVREIFCNPVVSCAFKKNEIMAEIDTALVGKEGASKFGPRTRLIFKPETAKQMAHILTKVVAEYEKKHGVVDMG